MKQPEEVYMKFRSLMTAICVLAAAQIASAAGPYAYIANSGTKTVSVIDTAITPTGDGSNAITATVTLKDDNGAGTLPDPYAYSITVGASGQYVYVGVQDTNEVQIIDTSTNTVLPNKRIYLQTDKPGGLAVNAAETRLYVAVNNSNTLRIIDISGSGASEVGRVTVSDSAQSVPEGVVLNAAGTKAYVANSADGQDSIAEITLDEATNTYTRSSIIPLPAGSKPYGLAINGTKLYFSSFNGNAGVVDTSTKLPLLNAVLNATNEVPPNGSTATGTAAVSFDAAKTTITAVLNTTGLTNITAARINSGNAGQNGGVMFTLSPTTFTSPLTKTLTSADLDPTFTSAGKTFTDAVNAILNGAAYVNVSTSANVGGEIRGQISVIMPTDVGNLSIAVNPVSGNVYAASNSFDRLYAFNSAGAAIGVPQTGASGPRGISVNPLGTKLFVAMNLDDTVKVFDPANLATEPVTIKIPDGAKPNSFGNFIGPVWDRTILATNGAGCTITPSGTVPVNYKGWTFTISGTGCDVKVNGTSVGAVTSWQITGLPAIPPATQITIDASQLPAGNYFTVAGDWITSVGGYLVSTPTGINAGSKSAQFIEHTNVSLDAKKPEYKAINWTGSCAGTPDGQPCVFPDLSANKLFGATIIPASAGGPIFDGSSYYPTWAACTSGAANYAAIKLSTEITTLATDATGPAAAYQYTMSSQWIRDAYTSKGYVPLTLTITNVAIIANDLTL
jgi:DNA-binding beta-propeller fold protein YncE